MSNKVEGFKGFDENLKCRGFQYEIGKTYEHNGTATLCSSGFHFCENPLDVLRYYKPLQSKYATVEGEGVSDEKDGGDTKRVASKLTVKAELSLSALIGLGVKFLINKSTVKGPATSGNYSHAATSGYSSSAATSGDSSPAATSGDSSHAATSGSYSHAATSGNSSPAATSGNSSPAATSGNYSHAATSGNYSHAATSGYSSSAATSGNSSPAATSGYSSSAATSGKESIAASIGRGATAKAALGNWIVLAEYKKDNCEVLTVKTVKVDGRMIQANTFYQLKKGEFVKAEEL